MTTKKEFEAARNTSAATEPNLRTEFAHCRGFRAGAEWASKRIADGLSDESATSVAVRYARHNEQLAADTDVKGRSCGDD